MKRSVSAATAALVSVSMILGTTVIGSDAMAQTSMTVREFNQIQASTPRNPTSLLRPSARRAWGVMKSSIEASMAEEARARSSGARPPFCIPAQNGITPRDFVNRMNAVPQVQQGRSVHQAVRVWMVERFPCP